MNKIVSTGGSNCPDRINHHTDEGMELHGSPAAPIRIEETRPAHMVRWEYEHIDRILTLPRRCIQSLAHANGRWLDRIVVRDANFRHHAFYFDVTEKLAVETKEIQAAVDNLKKNRDRLSPTEQEMLEAIEQDEKKRGS